MSGKEQTEKNPTPGYWWATRRKVWSADIKVVVKVSRSVFDRDLLVVSRNGKEEDLDEWNLIVKVQTPDQMRQQKVKIAHLKAEVGRFRKGEVKA